MFALRVGSSVPDLHVHTERRSALLDELDRKGIVRDFGVQFRGANGEIRDCLSTLITMEYEAIELARTIEAIRNSAAADHPNLHPRRVVPDSTQAVTLLKRLKQLLADDDGAFRTKVATNGEKALVLASAADRPDLMLLDITMPGMDGYEVCRRLKANQRPAAFR